MKNLICEALRRAILALPLSPKHHLYSHDGNLYMGRWNIVGQYKTDAKGRDIIGSHTWQSRALLWLTRGKWASVRLHRIMQSDHDRHFHNHPFRFKSIILKGSYIEAIPGPMWFFTDNPLEIDTRAFHVGDVNRGEEHNYHRIMEVSPGGVWTLFFMGPNTNEWGFYVPSEGGYMKSSRYFLWRRIGKGLRGE